MRRTKAPPRVENRVVKIYHARAWRVAILGRRGHKFTQAVIQHPFGVKHVQFPNREADQAPAAKYRGGEYPVARAKRLFRQAAKRGPLSKPARQLLKGGAA